MVVVLDPFLEAADQITPTGAVYKGDSNEIYVVHTCPIPEGKVFHAAGISVMIQRRATREEYMERCPQVPPLGKRGRHYFYFGLVIQPKVKLCGVIEGDLAHCPLTDTVLSTEEFNIYACREHCGLQEAELECRGAVAEPSRA